MADPGRLGAVSGSQAAVVLVSRVLARCHWAFPFRGPDAASAGGLP